ncbi:hypothetical protein ACFO4O_14640 [Glaciecola siphonariae]|uniref:YD repeat-containing protein n=1 Tax=Glaciecola siphonariae TaxID=521012 RepID=A0ABV9LYZ3_9ALTE
MVEEAKVNGVKHEYTWNSTGGVTSSITASKQSDKGNASISATAYKGGEPQIGSSSWVSGNALYDGIGRNLITELTEKGIKSTFEYDARRNVFKRTQHSAALPDVPALANIVEEASYPTTCTNIKTCNKPTYIIDGEGNKTEFDYHDETGLVKRIRSPENAQGIRPTQFFRYQKHYAYYRKGSNRVVKAATPIWLLTETETCVEKAASATACAPSDALKTKYEYSNNNLWLSAKIDVATDGSTRRTCYAYDIYGNMIGEISPNAKLSTCP